MPPVERNELAQWRGKVDATLDTYFANHNLHFKEIEELKISLVELKAKISVYALLGGFIGSTIATFIIALVVKNWKV